RATGALLAFSASGLSRWRIEARQGELRISPDKHFIALGGETAFDISASGKVIAVAQFNQAQVFHADRPNQRTVIRGVTNTRMIAVSPDGKYVATGSHGEEGASVWDAATGALLEDIPTGRTCHVTFSPDGKWLLTGGGEARSWEVGTWRPGAP